MGRLRRGLACLITTMACWSVCMARDGTSARPPEQWNCGRDGRPALQILGSGAPLDAGGRASASYLIWLDSRPRLLIDVGAGAAVNFARAGADVRDLDAVLISHIHPDHVSDLPALLWSADVVERSRPLLVAGPQGRGEFPAIAQYLERLFGPQGAYPFMKDILARSSAFHLRIMPIAVSRFEAIPLTTLDAVRISAFPVEHGQAPTVAYRLDGAGFSIVFAADQTGATPGFAAFASNADLLVLHTALSPHAVKFAGVIGLPQNLGKLAARAHAKSVVLAHLMDFPPDDPREASFSLHSPTALEASIESVFRGRVTLAADGECLALGHPRRLRQPDG
jgi:ribonuclease BN (tRNA processing enzyme)